MRRPRKRADLRTAIKYEQQLAGTKLHILGTNCRLKDSRQESIYYGVEQLYGSSVLGLFFSGYEHSPGNVLPSPASKGYAR
jgi:hypothetical protein